MGRHGDDDRPTHTTWPLPIGNTGRHSDDPLDDLDQRRSPWRRVLFWSMIALAVVMMIIVSGGMINSAQRVIGTGNDDHVPATVTETETVEVPGPETTREVPGPNGTVIQRVTVPGPTITKTVTSPPTATPSPVPGPTVTVKVTVPGPVQYQETPGPTRTVETPGPTETRCYILVGIENLKEIPCP